ncbi:integration host factor beta subunit [Roseovarius sp. 217]|nr:integration host factor beta subunit [Roseovarius sp. 217]
MRFFASRTDFHVVFAAQWGRFAGCVELLRRGISLETD